MGEQAIEQRNLAFFFDCENIGLADCDVSHVMQWVAAHGRPVIRRAYGDWSKNLRLKDELMAAAVELVEMPCDVRGKNRADIRLTVDAMEVAFVRHHIDTYVIASGDSDFIPLLNRLREFGKETIVLARRRNSSNHLPAACDQLVYFDEIAKTLPNYQQRLASVSKLLAKAVANLRGSKRTITLESLKKALLRADERFCHTRYGFESLEKFLKTVDSDLFDSITENLLPLPAASVEQVTSIPESNSRDKKSTKKLRTDSKLSMVSNDQPATPLEVVDRIYWAVQILKEAGKDYSNLGTIHNELRVLFPEFKVTHFGFPRSSGFRKVFASMELDSLCTLMPNNPLLKTPWKITFHSRFFSRTVQVAKPDVYADRLARLLPAVRPLPGPTIPKQFPVPSFANRSESDDAEGRATILEFVRDCQRKSNYADKVNPELFKEQQVSLARIDCDSVDEDSSRSDDQMLIDWEYSDDIPF